MGFRFLQLQYETMKEKAIITEGVLFKQPCYVADFGFAKLNSQYTPQKEDLRVSLIYDFTVKDKADGFKELDIRIPVSGKLREGEEGILILIRHADSVKGKTKIAGRYAGEGIWLLKPNDKISVTRGNITENFVALNFENKMYLVKMYDDEE